MSSNLIKCLKGHKSLGSLCSVVKTLIVSGNRARDNETYWAVRWQLKRKAFGYGLYAPCRPGLEGYILGMLAPPRKKQALPRPAPPRKIDKSRGAQRGKTDCRFHWWSLFITPTNYALEEEREGKYFHLTLCTDCDYLVHKNTFFKVREYNVFLYQNIIMHYKYINIIVKQFTHFCRIFGSVDLRAFSPRPVPPRPADFHRRPAPRKYGPPRTSLQFIHF